MVAKRIEYPTLRINKAIELIEKFEKELKGYSANRDAFAKLLGYSSSNNGAFINTVSDLRKYGLLDKRGDIRITELGRKIVYAKAERREEYILEAITNVSLFRTLSENIGNDIEGINFEAQLINAGFSQVEALKKERKIKNIYKTLTPYITIIKTNKNIKENDDFESKGDNLSEVSQFEQGEEVTNFNENEVYRANLLSDGISLTVPKNKAKIAKLKFLIKCLEEEMEEEESKKTAEN